MPTSIHYPLTPEQRNQLPADLAFVEERLQDISVLIHACYGDENQVAIRADEVGGALQRLKWELARIQPKTRTAAG